MAAEYWLHAVQKEERSSPFPTSTTVRSRDKHAHRAQRAKAAGATPTPDVAPAAFSCLSRGKAPGRRQAAHEAGSLHAERQRKRGNPARAGKEKEAERKGGSRESTSRAMTKRREAHSPKFQQADAMSTQPLGRKRTPSARSRRLVRPEGRPHNASPDDRRNRSPGAP